MKDVKEFIFSFVIVFAVLSLLITAGTFFGGPSGKVTASAPSTVGVYPPVDVLRDDFCCNTTNFTALTTQELFNVENLTLQVFTCGKIVWPGPINLILDEDNLTVDLDGSVIMAINLADVNSSKATSLNTSATVLLCELPFTDPYVLRNGERCPENVCTLTSYSNPGGDQGIAIFNVTHWSNYSLTENATQAATPSPGGGGGGGGRGLPPPTLIPPKPAQYPFVPGKRVEITVRQGEEKAYPITIINPDSYTRDVNIKIVGLRNYVGLDRTRVTLTPDSKVQIAALVHATTDDTPGVYTGWLELVVGGHTERFPLIIRVIEAEPDVLLDVLLDKNWFESGQDVPANISIRSTLSLEGTLVYYIRDMQGNIYALNEEERFAVDGNVNLLRKLPMQDYPSGDYLWYAEFRYDSKTAPGSASFFLARPPEVEQPGKAVYRTVIIWFIVAWFLIIAVLFLLLDKNKKQLLKRKWMHNRIVKHGPLFKKR